MKLYTHVERIERELADVGLAEPAALRVADLEAIDQMHYLGLAAVESAIDSLGLGADDRVLDIGAGMGGPARVLAKRRGCHVTAIELQDDLNACARRLTERCGLDKSIDHVHADIFDFAPEQSDFDAVVSWLCFLHIDDKTGLFRHCRELLAPGGQLYIEDFTARKAFNARERDLLENEVYCRHLLEPDDYMQALREAGFEHVRLEDMTVEWSAFVGDRLAAFEAGRDDFQALHGKDAWLALHHFYASVVELFRGQALGGARIIARAGTSGRQGGRQAWTLDKE